jgi:hypothetical protein
MRQIDDWLVAGRRLLIVGHPIAAPEILGGQTRLRRRQIRLPSMPQHRRISES